MATQSTTARGERRQGPSDPADREAPYKYEVEYAHSKRPWKPDRLTGVTFYQRDDATSKKWHALPPESEFARRPWKVGLAINHHATTDNPGASLLGRRGTHWGVHMSPVVKDSENDSCRIYGLNFRDATRQAFIVGQKWRTSNGYEIEVDRSDFDTKDNYDMQIICSLEEFILTAQRTLDEFSMGPHPVTGQRGLPRGGDDSYNVFGQNCHAYATKLLGDIRKAGWEAADRMGTCFRLADMKTSIEGTRKQDIINPLATRIAHPWTPVGFPWPTWVLMWVSGSGRR